MISKLCVWARTRDVAIARMERALYEYVVVGVKTNIPFHKAVMRNPAFRRGYLTTSFIEDQNILVAVEEVVKSDAEKELLWLQLLKQKTKRLRQLLLPYTLM